MHWVNIWNVSNLMSWILDECFMLILLGMSGETHAITIFIPPCLDFLFSNQEG